jgi:hypothetical protein
MAVDWLKEVIDNKDVADNMVVTLAGGKTVTVGEVRSLTKASQKALSEREGNLAAKEAKLQKDLETLQLAQAETAKLFTELQSHKNDRSNDRVDDKPDPLLAMENDPILGPLAKDNRALRAALDELKTKGMAPIAKAIQDMATSYVNDRIEMDYDRIVPDAKKSAISLESILKVANDNGLKTRTGIPDLRRAYNHMTTKPMTQEDIDAQLKAAREEGRKEAADAARLRVPRPGIGSAGGRPESEFKPTISANTTVASALEEAISRAAKDADIWAAVDNGVVQ